MRITLILLIAMLILILLNGCKNHQNDNVIRFGIDATNPPYNYMEDNEFKGFNVDLDMEIAKQLNKKAEFHVMSWASILPALHNNKIDAVATVTSTPEREKNISFSKQYTFDYIAAAFKKENPIKSKSDIVGKRVGCVIGTNTEIFLKKNFNNNITIILSESNSVSLKLLKANHVDLIVLEKQSAALFSQKDKDLSYHVIEKNINGDSVALKKDSPLIPEINKALDNLERNGVIKKLENKWLR
jgi:ABC-type amino acid transport substrate-binding protein